MSELFKGIKSAIPHIKMVLSTLPPVEQRVARYVLDNPQTVTSVSINELADEIKVAVSTIVRFCKNVGFSGFSELKIALIRDLVTDSFDIYQDFSENISSQDSLGTMAKKLGYANAKAIEETDRLLDLDSVERAIGAILNARQVLFYGVGASSATALDGKFRFFRLGIHCDAIVDTHLMLMSTAMLKPNDVVILFSMSGRTKELVEAVLKAKETRATVISITGQIGSALAKNSDICLLTAHVDLPYGSGALRTKIAQLHVLDLLYTGLSLGLGKTGRYFMELTGSAVFEKVIT